MYHINSREEKPNIGYMLQRVTDLMQRGIKVANLDDLYSKFESERDNIAKEITAKYGIKNPNSSLNTLRAWITQRFTRPVVLTASGHQIKMHLETLHFWGMNLQATY